MTLDNVIQALDAAMKGTLTSTTACLQDIEAVQAVIAYNAEREHGKRTVVNHLTHPVLLNDYLQLPLKERDVLEQLTHENPNWLQDLSKFKILRKKDPRQILRRQYLVKATVKIFDFYVENRKEDQFFGPCYVTADRALNKLYTNLGHKIYDTAHHNIKGGFNEIIQLTKLHRPEMCNHLTSPDVFRHFDGPPQLVRLFDFYLQHRKEGQFFGAGYLCDDPLLKRRTNNLGNSVYSRSNGNSGFDALVQQTLAHCPAMRYHLTIKDVFRNFDGPAQLVRLFDFYLQHRKEGQWFGSGYLATKQANKENRLGINVYTNAQSNLEGGFEELLRLAMVHRPAMRNYLTFREVFCTIDGPAQIVRIFDFYLQHRKKGQFFGPGYLKDSLLRKRYKNLGINVYQNALKNFDRGFDELLELALAQRPEMHFHFTCKDVFRNIDGPEQLIRCFDFYLQHRKEGQKFGANYLQVDPLLQKRHGNLGKNAYYNSNYHLENGFDELIQITAKQRPEILQYYVRSKR